MRQNFDKIEFIVGNSELLDKMTILSTLKAFDTQTTEFLSELSSKLLSKNESKLYPDVVTLAFWLRRANLHTLEAPYSDNLLGRGIAFHIAPSNVPVNFAYSLAAGMLAGDANVVRVPSKDFPQVNIICRAINELLPEFPIIAERLCLIRYGHDKEITDALSEICSTRIIWGGDSTIDEIRKSRIPPRTNEITFPDRFSVCIIDADKYLSEYDKSKTAKDFYNDTFLTDQNACTSPRIVFWLGKERERAKEIFWAKLESLTRNYNLKAIQAVNKFTTFFEYAANNRCVLLTGSDNRIIRVKTAVTKCMLDNLNNSGYFYECDIDSLDEIIPICTRKLQTLSYIGFTSDELRDFVLENGLFGIDRVTPVGKTMDFSLIWDGIDLIKTMARKI